MSEFHTKPDNTGVLLKDKFATYHGKRLINLNVSIYRQRIVYESVDVPKPNFSDCLRLSDVVGCRSFGGDVQLSAAGPKLAGTVSCLRIFAYRYNKKPENGGVRRRLELDLFNDQHEKKEENFALVERWRLFIQSLLNGVEFSSVDDLTEALLPPPRYYLVCINPNSGKGKASHIFKQNVRPLFDEAGITYKVITTERQGHGVEIARNLDLKKYNGIVIVSGDGLLYEFIQGFKERDDKEEAFKLPFGMIPGGSGNALCAAILTDKGEQTDKNMALHSAFTIIKGKPRSKDLVRVENIEQTFFSFISVNWGLIADIDIESERFRFMGEARFTVGAFTRIMFLRRYPGRLSFLPIADQSKYAHIFHQKKANNNQSNGTNGLPESTENQISHIVNNEGNTNSNASTAMMKNASGAIADDNEVIDLPPLSDPVPSDWTVIEGDFITVIVSFMSHLSRDFLTHPGQKLDEGVITLHYMDAHGTRKDLMGLFDDVKSGEYIGKDFETCKFVRAFRLEPLNSDGILTVDGERVRFGPIQGSMMSLKCQCIA